MGLPVAAIVGKGTALVKGVSVKKLANAGIGVVSATKLAKGLTSKEKAEIEKSSKKAGIKIDFDVGAKNSIKTNFYASNKEKKKGVSGSVNFNPNVSLNFTVKPQKENNKHNSKSENIKKSEKLKEGKLVTKKESTRKNKTSNNKKYKAKRK